jgi:NiFe hydrogenase small subunit HydA
MRKEYGLAARDLVDTLRYSSIKRRDFLRFCGVTAGLLGLSEAYIPKIAHAIEKGTKRPPVVWLNFASDTGCTESLIKATYPNAADLVLDILSVDYNETIMAAAGQQVEEILQKSLKDGNYILVIEGGIPTKHGYGMIAGKDMMDITKEFAPKAIAILAVGSCATHGGVPAANPNPSAIKGVSAVLGDAYKGKIVNLDLCPVNVEVLVAVIVNYLLFKKLPELDVYGRPKTFYGQLIHDNCERRAHFDAGRFVERFGTEEEALGYCLYKMGCKGPMTYAPCPKILYNDRISWCIKAGAPCIGCGEQGWTDKFAGFYERLPDVSIPGFKGVEFTADKIGLAAGVATAVGIAAHAIASSKRIKKGGEE